MIKVAITGNIASGKSEVEKIIKNQGYKVLCTDNASHRLLESNENVKEAVFREFGTLNRKELGEIVFKNPLFKKKLESIIHPNIKEEIGSFFQANKDEKLLFVGIPLLYESKMERLFDKVVLVCTSEDVRLERMLKRNDYSKEHAKARIASQMSEAQKRTLADIVIENDSDLKALQQKTKEALKLLV